MAPCNSYSMAFLTCLLLFSNGCGDPPPSDYPVQQVYVEDTTLGSGDRIEIRVFRQKEMTGEYAVTDEGAISFPLIGAVEVAGKTPAEVARLIRDRLADGYLLEPNVSIVVKEYKSKTISVLGQVRRPGTLPFVGGMTVVDAVAQAGGFADLARKNAVQITRVVDGKPVNYTVPVEDISQGKYQNFYVRPRDQIWVPRRPF